MPRKIQITSQKFLFVLLWLVAASAVPNLVFGEQATSPSEQEWRSGVFAFSDRAVAEKIFKIATLMLYEGEVPIGRGDAGEGRFMELMTTPHLILSVKETPQNFQKVKELLNDEAVHRAVLRLSLECCHYRVSKVTGAVRGEGAEQRERDVKHAEEVLKTLLFSSGMERAVRLGRRMYPDEGTGTMTWIDTKESIAKIEDYLLTMDEPIEIPNGLSVLDVNRVLDFGKGLEKQYSFKVPRHYETTIDGEVVSTGLPYEFVARRYAVVRDNGLSDEQIAEKSRKIEGVLGAILYGEEGRELAGRWGRKLFAIPEQGVIDVVDTPENLNVLEYLLGELKRHPDDVSIPQDIDWTSIEKTEKNTWDKNRLDRFRDGLKVGEFRFLKRSNNVWKPLGNESDLLARESLLKEALSHWKNRIMVYRDVPMGKLFIVETPEMIDRARDYFSKFEGFVVTDKDSGALAAKTIQVSAEPQGSEGNNEKREQDTQQAEELARTILFGEDDPEHATEVMGWRLLANPRRGTLTIAGPKDKVRAIEREVLRK